MTSDPRVALVTHVEQFVGLPVADALSAAGFTVVCHDPSFEDASARKTFAATHPDWQVSAEQAPGPLVAEVVERHGRVDVLVSNDVHPAVRARVEEADLDDLRATLEALVVAPFAMVAAVVPVMKPQGSGKIVIVSSGTPLRGLANYGMYCAARGGANALAVSLARELARHNIQVNAIAPNFVENPTYFPASLLAEEKNRVKILSQVPMGRLGRPEEAGSLVAFLAGSGSDFITGRVIPLDGGWA